MSTSHTENLTWVRRKRRTVSLQRHWAKVILTQLTSVWFPNGSFPFENSRKILKIIENSKKSDRHYWLQSTLGCDCAIEMKAKKNKTLCTFAANISLSWSETNTEKLFIHSHQMNEWLIVTCCIKAIKVMSRFPLCRKYTVFVCLDTITIK